MCRAEQQKTIDLRSPAAVVLPNTAYLANLWNLISDDSVQMPPLGAQHLIPDSLSEIEVLFSAPDVSDHEAHVAVISNDLPEIHRHGPHEFQVPGKRSRGHQSLVHIRGRLTKEPETDPVILPV